MIIGLPLTLFIAVSCAAAPEAPREYPADSKRVLVVENKASKDSLELSKYYREKRRIPPENLVTLDVEPKDNVSLDDYIKKIEDPIKARLGKSEHRIDFIVMTKGVPIRMIDDWGRAVDSQLAAMRMDFKAMEQPEPEQIKRSLNPYFNKNEHFDSSKFNMYLVTRLDGYTLADAKKLVDNSLAAKPSKGPFFFDQAANRTDQGYGELNKALETAAAIMKKKEFKAALESTSAFVAPSEALMGYCSWGSNDSNFSAESYHALKFQPGAVCETFVSTSGRTFAKPTVGQSLVADLIAQGVTGVKGYVSEPYTFALARPEILFDRYTSGFNLAESFYMASLVTKWKDVVIGDPLCNPYSKE
ncbi:MAG: TIGR03790 family protein [Fimbriimonadaceae bacterium]|nr:TIGR03790 family protein [Fimbriimonadaceae bacterium]QYK55829.1 MAG: TIGR03790 family protein [Fimbriimonadaceae bacterium]